MNTPTPYLDGIVLASAAYPSGFSTSLYTSWKGLPREGSTLFLAFLALPYLVLCPSVWALRPSLLVVRGAGLWWWIAACLTAAIALASEYVIHGLALYRKSGRFPTWFAVHSSWQRRLSWLDHILLAVVVIGEELVYRTVGIGILSHAFGLPLSVALLVTSVGYGVNHLAFGGLSVLSKTVAGLLYGVLFLLGGESILLPILAHGLQNIALFGLAREINA